MQVLYKALGLFFASLGLVVLIALFAALPTYLLWNACLVPAIEGVNEIGFGQALGINILASILFKSTANVKDK
jgi:uncharacterized membrane protein